MLKSLIRDLKIHKKSWIFLLCCMLGLFIMGVGMVILILKTDETTTTYFCMGTLMSVFSILGSAVFNGIYFRPEFNLALSMGETRKRFLGLYALRQLLLTVVGYGAVLALMQLELVLYRSIFPTLENEDVFYFLTDWRIILPVMIACVLLPMFIGTLHSRFGKPVMVILYFVWLACCMLPSQLSHNETLMNTVSSVPVAAWIGLGIAAMIAMAVTVIRLGSKQMVQ